MNPIVYKWNDGNAPVARGERRSLCDILYACLVTGYGDKSGAGWTREFVNATFDTAVFRNNPATGTGFFIQIDGAGGPQVYQPYIRAYELMVDYTTTGAQGFFGSTGYPKISDTANTTARPWVLVADDRAFYFSVWNGNAAGLPATNVVNVNSIFFGDLVKYYPSDGFACAFAVSLYNSGAFGTIFEPGNNSTSAWNLIYTPRRADGSGAGAGQQLKHGGGPGPFSANAMGSSGMPFVSVNSMIYAQPFLSNASGANNTIRGWLPGLYYPCHPYTSFSQFQELTFDDMTVINIAHNMGLGNTPSQGCMFIKLTDWWV